MWAPTSALERLWLEAIAARDSRSLLQVWERYLQSVDPEGSAATFRQTDEGWLRVGPNETKSGAEQTPRALDEGWRRPFPDVAVQVGSARVEEAAWTVLETAWPRVVDQERARALTTLDEVTGLFNARHLQHVLEQEVARCRRFGRAFSVLFVDLDHFKAVNDSLGHAMGTRLLAQIGGVLRRKLRSSDHAFRYGGDEFVVCLIETKRSQAMEVAERIRSAIEKWASTFDDIRTDLTASIGVACFPEDAASAEGLVEFADQRMYAAKRAGRNEVRTADLVPSPRDPPTVILWDVMGTLVTEPFKEAMPRFLGLSFEEMLARKDPNSWIEFEHGHIDEDEYLRRFFVDGAPVDKEGLKAAMRDAYDWLPGVESILRELSMKGVRMHALSNYSDWYQMIEERTGMSRYVSWDFVSCQTGVRKPDPEAYLGAARALQVPPEACLFVDDRRVNVDAARQVGMQAILRNDDADDLAAELRRLGLDLG